MRLDGIEIKVTINADQVEAAKDAWLSGRDGKRRAIYFFEERPPGDPAALPLLRAGVILRVRQIEDGKDDSTAKLRPCDRSRLTAEWLAAGEEDDWKFTLEEDWVRDRHVLAASLVADQREGEIADVREHRRSPRALFSSEQERFLRQCAPAQVDWEAVRLLGPVDATRWKDVVIGRHQVVAELWRVGDALRFLELSIRTEADPGLAAEAQRDFEQRIRDQGLDPAAVQEPKTTTVLEHLARTQP
jgi:hypothetical protein